VDQLAVTVPRVERPRRGGQLGGHIQHPLTGGQQPLRQRTVAPELAAAGMDAPGDVLDRLAPSDSDAALAPVAGRQPIKSIIRG